MVAMIAIAARQSGSAIAEDASRGVEPAPSVIAGPGSAGQRVDRWARRATRTAGWPGLESRGYTTQRFPTSATIVYQIDRISHS